MTIEERVELYKSLYKECKALEPVANTLAKGYKQADPRKRLELIRELDTELAEVYMVMLQAGCRHSKLQRGLFVRIGVQAVNQTAAEGVAAAHAVNDIGDGVLAGEEEVLAVVQAGRPVVVVGRLRLTQGNRHASRKKHSLLCWSRCLVSRFQSGCYSRKRHYFQYLSSCSAS